MEDQIRCFIAVELPAVIQDEIGTYLSQLKKIAPEVRWVRAGSIHITLKFLGEQPASMVSQIEKKMDDVRGLIEPFTLAITGGGCFPNRRQPRVFWLGLEQDKSNPLFKVNAWIEDQMAMLGFDKEKRRFSPHLTLGRVRQPGDFSGIFDFFAENPFQSEGFQVKGISLMRSDLRTSGAVYSAVKQVSF